ncbi:MAG: hypothetical protein ACLTX6_10700 [Lachnospiraceae bacterium]
MFKIGILFDNREFEHDIYELIQSLLPGRLKLQSSYEEEDGTCSGSSFPKSEKQSRVPYNSGIKMRKAILGDKCRDHK